MAKNIKKIDYYSNILKEGMVSNYKKMLQEPEGKIKRPYIEPSGQYNKQLWDWDSYFASLALCRMLQDTQLSKRMTQDKEKIKEHIIGSFLNFFDYQSSEGVIPISITTEKGDIFECTNKNKGDETNMAKPVFGQFLELVIKLTGNLDIAKETFDKLLLFYECYKKYYYNKETGLFVWGSDVAIGVDDDPAVFGRPEFSSASIFLNSLMYSDFLTASRIAGKLERKTESEKLKQSAKELKNSIQNYCWDIRDSFYYTVDIQCKKKIHLGWIHENLEPFWKVIPLKILSWTGFMPLWARICDNQQAEFLVKKHLFNEREFLSKFGIRSLAENENMYQPEIARGNPSNWLGPVWIVANYIIWSGLKRYKYNKEADEIAKRVIFLLGQDMEENGFMHEYYSPVTGKGIMGKNFWNWNNLVIFML